MKKIIPLVIVIILVFMMASCSLSELPEGFDEEKVISRAKEIVELLNGYDFEAVTDATREDLKDDLSVETLEEALGDILEEAGEFEEYTKTAVTGTQDSSTGEDYVVVILVCKYDNGKQTFTISMDENLEIVGLYMK